LNGIIYVPIAQPTELTSLNPFPIFAHNFKMKAYNKEPLRIMDRLFVSRLPKRLKRVICDILAVVFYMPWVLLIRFFRLIGMHKFADRIPPPAYGIKSFFAIRNGSLDRFGTTLEQRFSKKEVIEMMEKCGLSNIVVSPGSPFYHAIGKK